MALRIPDPATVDFETEPIMPRPHYPPKPVGVSIMLPGEKKPRYYAWGHPVGNNCTKSQAARVLKQVYRDFEVLFQNGKFDVDVGETHMGLPRLPALSIHDTMFLLFLYDPHAKDLKLKPAAERILGMPPTEQQAVGQWLVEHQRELKADGLLPSTEPTITMQNFGKWICLAPGGLVGAYADGDVIRTYKLFRKLWKYVRDRGMLPAYEREQKLMPILLDNERDGMRCNLRLLEREVAMYSKERERADAWIRKQLKSPDLNIDSDAQLAEALRRSGVVTSFTKTAKGKDSVSKKNLKAEHFAKPQVYHVLMYRNKLSTCLGTFMVPWLEVARETGGIIHTSWNQVRQPKGRNDMGGARTGRLSSSPNFQNIPTDLEDKNDGFIHPTALVLTPLPFMRKFILPDAADHWFGRRDYNQQELRILAHFENGELLEAYQQNPNLDTHDFVKGVIENLLNHAVARSPVKTLNFGYIYGQGVPSMAEKLNLPVNDVKKLRSAQLKALPGLKDLSRDIKILAASDEPIHTWGGREYYVEPPAFSKKYNKMMSFEYKLLNYLIQGSAGDVTKEAIIRYHELPKRESRMLVTVHDEIDISAPKTVFKEEMLRLREVMESIEMDVLMLSDGEYGPNWGALRDLKEPR